LRKAGSFSLEGELQCHLSDPAVASHPNKSDVAVDGPVRIGELSVIKGIEKLCSKFKRCPLGDRRVLVQGKIPVVNTRTMEKPAFSITGDAQYLWPIAIALTILKDAGFREKWGNRVVITVSRYFEVQVARCSRIEVMDGLPGVVGRIRAAAATEGSITSLAELGKLLVASNQFTLAAGEFEQAVKHDPGLSAAYYQLGRVYSRLGQVDKSQHMFAEFERLHKKEQQDPALLDQEQNDDARQATQTP
jgi:tetratricopeptide (TPR) repeat protein